MGDGAFTPAVKVAISESHGGVCVGGCGRPATDHHHRRPRGRGGTRRAAIGEPYNGLPVCAALHYWIETNRDVATRLGWLTPTPNPDAPFWTATFGWCTWLLDPGPPTTWLTRPFQPAPNRTAFATAWAFRHP